MAGAFTGAKTYRGWFKERPSPLLCPTGSFHLCPLCSPALPILSWGKLPFDLIFRAPPSSPPLLLPLPSCQLGTTDGGEAQADTLGMEQPYTCHVHVPTPLPPLHIELLSCCEETQLAATCDFRKPPPLSLAVAAATCPNMHQCRSGPQVYVVQHPVPHSGQRVFKSILFISKVHTLCLQCQSPCLGRLINQSPRRR